MDIKASEISSILKEQIKGFDQRSEVSEIGQVLSVGDGIAGFTASTMCRPVKWLSFPAVFVAWR